MTTAAGQFLGSMMKAPITPLRLSGIQLAGTPRWGPFVFNSDGTPKRVLWQGAYFFLAWRNGY